MALQRTLVVGRPQQLFLTHSTNPKIASSQSLNLKRHSPLFKKCSLKCSATEYGHKHDAAAAEYPKPAEIQWRKELCNSVQLIGVVGAPVEIRHLPSGKVVAWTRLAVKKSATDTSWINLTFWDELAQTAVQHVEKGHQIYVSGRLVSDFVEDDEGKQQTYYKVVVQQLNFIERSFSSGASSHDRDSNAMMTSKTPQGNNYVNGTGSIEELWQAFFANPTEWWDNRNNKKNPRYPDFKHKDTGEALWVEGRYNPSWVKSQLAILDERMGSLLDQDANTSMFSNSSGGRDLLSF